ncbi:MAG: hypothetical protein IJ149_02385 [Oscillospiraceae bacterium]|nr:hypothetical protein [Oscillospiraceae bacterium]
MKPRHYLREQLKTYPNEPELLTHLAAALQTLYFHQGKAIALCERALKYYKPVEGDTSGEGGTSGNDGNPPKNDNPFWWFTGFGLRFK